MDAPGKNCLFRKIEVNSDICITMLGCTEVLTHKMFVTQEVPIKHYQQELSLSKHV